tara:strand:- start:117 stop:413 length:297 start_codon:yes stop_codon:yes gene_type:complete
MKKYKNINEIRNDIDQVDLKILKLIQKRKELVTEVVKLKNRDQIIDEDRINKILNELKAEAINLGIPHDIVIEIWKVMIDGFIRYEEEIFDTVHKKNL